MVTERPDNNFDRDVYIGSTSGNQKDIKHGKITSLMIRLGVFVTYCVLLLIKKISSILSRCALFFSSKVTSMLSTTISKLKNFGKLLLSPFVRFINLRRGRYSAEKLSSDDMSVKSIRTTAAGRFLSRAYNYVLPAAAVAAFAAVINSTSKIEAGMDYCLSSAGYDARSLADNLESASEELSKASEEPFVQKRAVFEDPLTALEKYLSTDNLKYVDAYGVYADGEFIGASVRTEEIESFLNKKLEERSKAPGVVEASYKKQITYRKEKFIPDKISDPEKIISILSAEKTEDYYTIEEGDSLFLIAEDHGMTFEELMDLNPEIADPDLCFAGSRIRVSCHIEKMPVIITVQEEETVSVPFETMTVESDSLFSGESEILVDGENGESINTVYVKYEGVNQIDRKVVSSRIVREPVAEMIAVGTKTTQTQAAPWSEETVLNGTGKFMWPVNGGWISDTFGSDRNHKGLDIAAGEGTDIYAAADGKVVAAGWNTGGYGYFVMIDHGDGYVTLYAHMSKVIASNGAEVRCGDLIGEVGTTGDSTGDHLHFEVRYQNICQNPALYLRVNAPDDAAAVPAAEIPSSEEAVFEEEYEEEYEDQEEISEDWY